MAFTTDKARLYQEIENAISIRDSALVNIKDQIARLAGSSRGKVIDGGEAAMNYSALWLSVMMSRLIYNNPKVLVTAGEAIDGQQTPIQEAAHATEIFVNAWNDAEGLNKKLRRCAVDYAMAWCAGMVTRKKHPGDHSIDTETERYMPEFVRIPPWRMIIDPYCEDVEEARYLGHTWYCDKDDLVELAKAADEDEGWDVGAVEAMQTEVNAFSSNMDPRDGQQNNRDEVVLLDLWFPEKLHDEDLGPEEGFHGTIMTLGWDSNQQTVYDFRKPRPCFCPASGPYAIGGYMPIPMSPFPMGPLAMTFGHESLVRDMVQTANTGCLEYKRAWLIPAGTDASDAAKKVLGSGDVVIPVPGMAADAKPIEIEIGGVTDMQLRNIMYSRGELERLGGLDGPGTGKANSHTTATSDAIAAESRKTISDHIVDNFHDFVREIEEKVAWYGFSDEDVKIALGDDVDGIDGQDLNFEGGPGDLDMSAFLMFTIDIEPHSMERMNDAMHQHRVMQAFGLIVQIAQFVRQMPEVDWKAVISMIGDALNMPNLDQMIDIDMAMQLAGVPVQAGQGQGQAGGLGIDAGFNRASAPQRPTQGQDFGAILGQVAGVA